MNNVTHAPTYIAVDFDGVLHHHHAGPYKSDRFDTVAGVEGFKKTLQTRIAIEQSDDIFFDADGSLFDRESHLIQLLALLPQAKIVLATSWRNIIPPTHLPQFLAPEIQARIDGVLAPSEAEVTEDGVRGELMIDWLRQNDRNNAAWIALDDQTRHYCRHPDRLVKTHWRGMMQCTVDSAVQRLGESLHKGGNSCAYRPQLG